MARSKGRIPFTSAWRAKYREKLRSEILTDAHLLDKEVKYRKVLYQISISAGFYIGAHVGAAIALSGVTIPASVVQLTWQTYCAIEASSKHKMIMKEIVARGLDPRNMTAAEKTKMALFAALSIAVGQAIDAVAADTLQDQAKSLFSGHHEPYTQAAAELMHSIAANPGEAISEGLAQGGSSALSFAFDALAIGVGTSGGIKLGETAISIIRSSDKENRSQILKRSNTITVKARCSSCLEYFSTVLSDAPMQRTCNGCQFKKLTAQREKEVRSTAKEVAALHLNIFCDECCSGIMGARYTCKSCFEHDLCEDCYYSPALSNHVRRHQFVKLVASDFTTSLVQVEMEFTVHKDVYCDGCHYDLVGSRSRCTTCPYFDLCQVCFAESPGRNHDPSHTFELICTY